MSVDARELEAMKRKAMKEWRRMPAIDPKFVAMLEHAGCAHGAGNAASDVLRAV